MKVFGHEPYGCIKRHIMLTVTRLAETLGVNPDVIRHYTDVGLIHPAVSKTNGYRYFDEGDGLAVATIRIARSLEFSLPEAETFVSHPLAEQTALLETREAALDREIAVLLEKKERLGKIREFLKKTELCTGVVEDVMRGPIWSLYTYGTGGTIRRDPKTVAQWAAKFPFTHISLSLSREELNNPSFRGTYSVRLGYGVTDDYAAQSGLNLAAPVEYVPGGRFLIIYLKTADLFSLTSEDLRPLLEKAGELNAAFLNDTTGRLLAIEEKNGETTYFILIRVRIGIKTKD